MTGKFCFGSRRWHFDDDSTLKAERRFCANGFRSLAQELIVLIASQRFECCRLLIATWQAPGVHRLSRFGVSAGIGFHFHVRHYCCQFQISPYQLPFPRRW